MDQVKMKSHLLLVSPHQLSSSSGEADISNEEGDARTRNSHGALAPTSVVYDRTRTV